jgi:hypothetical protein
MTAQFSLRHSGGALCAAGWSLTSFKRTDPLIADYLQAIAADPATSTAIKAELKGLDTNPAFRETHGK